MVGPQSRRRNKRNASVDLRADPDLDKQLRLHSEPDFSAPSFHRSLPLELSASTSVYSLHTTGRGPTPGPARAGPLVRSASATAFCPRIIGETISLGMSALAEFLGENAVFVDKSIAIRDVMHISSGEVIAGLYPRRMGKSTFLDTLADFLGIVRRLPYAKREKYFKGCAVYNAPDAPADGNAMLVEDDQPPSEGVEFFKKHFAKHPVFMLDFKEHAPMTRREAICALAKVVIQAARPYVNLLRNIASATGVPDHVVVDPGIVRQYQSDINAYVGQFDWLKNNVVTEADAPTITYLLPELITLLDDVLGCQSVVVVDEYDRPYMHLIRARDIDTTTRGHIMEMYTCFLSACLKNNAKLQKGILVGVFGVGTLCIGSGLNNVQAYFAHSDMGSYVPHSNPFERAFGFTLAEVQGLLDAYVQGKWTKKYPGANAVQFGQELLMHCTRFYDGYCIGNSAHMFNPHAILSFVQGLEKKLPPSTSVLKVQTAWADTGSTRVIETMMTNDICALQGYICPLMDEYSHRFNCRWGESLDSNVLFPMPASQAADDYDSAAIAKVCLSEDPLALDKALAASEHGYNVDAVLLILYQAGYIAPVSSNRVAIPNMEVLLALVDFVGRLSQRHILCDYTALDTGLAGLLEANLAKFADGCNAQIITLPLFRIGMLEADYQMILAIYFAPLCMAGIRVQCEECTGNGRTDIVVSPEPVASRKSSTAPPYWVFELKRYPEKLTAAYKKMKNQERMSRDNRLKMAKGAFDEARKACDQIICLYLASAKAKSSTIGSDWIYSVSMAFWFNRFCLIATRYQRCTGDDGRVSWNPVSFAEDDDGNVSPADSLEYEDINDNLDPENGSTVRTKILGGRFIAVSI